ncbi:MAG: 2-oxoacid:ferredoxin oxidoreductase subunit gamma [Peptococcaceae bacterium]|jgi:2-oxoglutarate ferredoxin oxidoreductase subunit gamma|nr:2-oxoacid:ferredoxin oxidoreductase subunit gamma [Peptococcaceae bacterium]
MALNSEIVLGGTGGQGLILAGQILADAAIKDGKNALQTQSYGPEARGGSSKAEVIISDGEIDYPKVLKPDILLVMSQEAFNKYADNLEEGGFLIIDTTFVKDNVPTGPRIFAAPYTRIAKDNLGKEMFANIVALGAIAAITGIVSKDSLLKALFSRIPAGTEELNQKALELGWDSVAKQAN